MKTVVLLVVLVSLQPGSLMQTTDSENKASAGDRLVLRLLFPSPSGCVGISDVDAEIVLRNETKTSVPFDVDLFRKSLLFVVTDATDGNYGGSHNFYSVSWSGSSTLGNNHVIVLPPDGSYWDTGKIALHSDSTRHPGILDIVVSYLPVGGNHLPGPVLPNVADTNSALLRIESCKK
jgi:hypothetical protein